MFTLVPLQNSSSLQGTPSKHPTGVATSLDLQGRAVLEAIRGTPEVDAEYGTIVFAHRREKAAGDNQWKTMASYALRPHLVMSIALPFFQQVPTLKCL